MSYFYGEFFLRVGTKAFAVIDIRIFFFDLSTFIINETSSSLCGFFLTDTFAKFYASIKSVIFYRKRQIFIFNRAGDKIKYTWVLCVRRQEHMSTINLRNKLLCSTNFHVGKTPIFHERKGEREKDATASNSFVCAILPQGWF